MLETLWPKWFESIVGLYTYRQNKLILVLPKKKTKQIDLGLVYRVSLVHKFYI